MILSEKKRGFLLGNLFLSVGVPGLEPGKAGPESAVLPLHHTPMNPCNFQLRVQRYYFFWNYQNFSRKNLQKNKKIPPIGGICYSLFSASIALIFSRRRFMSSFSFCTLRFISSMRLLPFLEEAFRKPRLFS